MSCQADTEFKDLKHIRGTHIIKPSLRYDYPLIPPNRASRSIRDEER